MKKIIALVLALVLCTSMVAFAANDISIQLDGKAIPFDQPPIIENNRTLVPLRGVLENMGYNVNWDEATNTAIISKYDVPYEVRVTIGSNKILKGDSEIEIDVPATIINDRTMVPIRAVSEAFEKKVDWDDESRSVLIYEE